MKTLSDFLNGFTLIKDLGVSALLTITTTLGTIGILVWLGKEGKVDDALKLAGPLIALTYKFLDAYMAKRKEDEERRERMAGTGNGNKPLESKP